MNMKLYLINLHSYTYNRPWIILQEFIYIIDLHNYIITKKINGCLRKCLRTEVSRRMGGQQFKKLTFLQIHIILHIFFPLQK